MIFIDKTNHYLKIYNNCQNFLFYKRTIFSCSAGLHQNDTPADDRYNDYAHLKEILPWCKIAEVLN